MAWTENQKNDWKAKCWNTVRPYFSQIMLFRRAMELLDAKEYAQARPIFRLVGAGPRTELARKSEEEFIYQCNRHSVAQGTETPFEYSETELWNMLWQQRERFQKDLFWAAKTVLSYDLADAYICWDHPKRQSSEPGICPDCDKPFSTYWTQDPADPESLYPAGSSPHRMIADFFVKKNPDRPLEEQEDVHDRLIMAPRGSYKSSVDQADCVQWVVTFPDVRILVLSAAERFTIDFVDVVRNFFVRPERDAGAKGKHELISLSWFQCLFLEHTVSSFTKEAEGEFTTPARTLDFKGIEPTLYAFGLKGTKSGYHFEVGKIDDCVSDSNSGPSAKPEARKAVADNIQLANGLIMPTGYRDILGTPYHEEDAYAPMILTAELNPEHLKFFRRPAWQQKPKSFGKKEAELGAEDYDLFFPVDGAGKKRHAYDYLRKRQLESERSADNFFPCQYLCQPTAVKDVRFSEALIQSHIMQVDAYQAFPQLYTAIAVWDIATSQMKDRRRDFSVGSVGWFDPFSRCFVKNIVRTRGSKYELAQLIAKQAAQWRVTCVKIEGSPGVAFLETDIHRELQLQGYSECPVEFFPVSTDKGAKDIRAELLEGALQNDRLFFSVEIDIMDQVIVELMKYRPGKSRKDDIIDSLAHLVSFAPPIEREMPSSQNEVQQIIFDLLRQRADMDRIFLQNQEALPVGAPPPSALPSQPLKMTEFDGYPIQEWTPYGT
jgi:hypothetical protein